VDIAAQWHQFHADALGTTNENTIKDNAVCFFNICQAAGLGKLTLGRKGSPTRLTINREELRAHIESGPSAPPWTDPSLAQLPVLSEETTTIGQSAKEQNGERKEELPGRPSAAQRVRIFISHGGDMEMVEQVQTMLGLADMDGEVAEKEETTAIPVPEKVFAAMRRCNAGIIVVAVDETNKDDKGKYALNDNVLIEIGAAFVLYDRRVVLLWDKRLQVPSNLQGLYRCEYEGNELSWGAGMKLMRAIQKFKVPEAADLSEPS
jgi:CAP12/Pycsar effector protein, TIR domain